MEPTKGEEQRRLDVECGAVPTGLSSNLPHLRPDVLVSHLIEHADGNYMLFVDGSIEGDNKFQFQTVNKKDDALAVVKYFQLIGNYRDIEDAPSLNSIKAETSTEIPYPLISSPGERCQLKTPRTQFCKGHYLLYYPEQNGSSWPENPIIQAEILTRAMRIGSEQAAATLGNPKAYFLFHAGHENVRSHDFHVHIFILDISQNRELFQAICAEFARKNLIAMQ